MIKMINKPSVENLSKKADSLYTIVIMAAKRARQINAGGKNYLEEKQKYNMSKPVTISLNEINKSKVTYRKNTENTLK
jgi:DNA-directed RNA polymerase subunit omega